jgi:hypothetical protein
MTESTGHLDLELTSWLDGELDAAGRERVESHLDACAACTALLAELRAVTAAARSLEDRAPEADLWPGIAQRIGVAGAAPVPAVVAPQPLRQPMTRARAIARRFSFSLPQLAAAALFVALLSGGTAWWAMRALMPAPAGKPVSPATAAPGGTAAGGVDASTADFEIRRYDEAVADLQHVLQENRGRLDPETVKTVETNLAAIDVAIAQARRALIADPANPYLTGHLADQMKRKIRVLQRTADAVTADYGGAS